LVHESFYPARSPYNNLYTISPFFRKFRSQSTVCSFATRRRKLLLLQLHSTPLKQHHLCLLKLYHHPCQPVGSISSQNARLEPTEALQPSALLSKPRSRYSKSQVLRCNCVRVPIMASLFRYERLLQKGSVYGLKMLSSRLKKCAA